MSKKGRHGGAEIAQAALIVCEGLSRLGVPLRRTEVARLLGLSDHDERVAAVWTLLIDRLDDEDTHLNVSIDEHGSQVQTGAGRSPLDKPIRMSEAETIAITKALALTGGLNDRLLRDLEAAWWPKNIDNQTISGMANEGITTTAATHIICQTAMDAGRGVSFDYAGEGKAPSRRRALPTGFSQGTAWMLEATDLDKQEHRRFRLDRMSNVRLLTLEESQVDIDEVESGSADSVRLLFSDAAWLDLFSWPGFVADEVPEEGYAASGTVPYFGTSFLPAQIAATGGDVVTTSDEVTRRAREWATNLSKELS